MGLSRPRREGNLIKEPTKLFHFIGSCKNSFVRIKEYGFIKVIRCFTRT